MLFIEQQKRYIYCGIDIIHSLLSLCQLNEKADKRVKEWRAYRPNTLHDGYGVNYFQIPFECKSKLEPKSMVTLWYKSKKYYDYTKEPSSPENTGKFIVLYMIF